MGTGPTGDALYTRQHEAGRPICASRESRRRTTYIMPRTPALSRPCIYCGSTFTPCAQRKNARFCSRTCSGRGMAQQIGDAQRDRGAGKSYRKRGGRHEHRVVMERIVGRPLRFEDVVHHKDGNIRNNDPDNLIIVTRAQHMMEHGLGIPGVPPHRFRAK